MSPLTREEGRVAGGLHVTVGSLQCLYGLLLVWRLVHVRTDVPPGIIHILDRTAPAWLEIEAVRAAGMTALGLLLISAGQRLAVRRRGAARLSLTYVGLTCAGFVCYLVYHAVRVRPAIEFGFSVSEPGEYRTPWGPVAQRLGLATATGDLYEVLGSAVALGLYTGYVAWTAARLRRSLSIAYDLPAPRAASLRENPT